MRTTQLTSDEGQHRAPVQAAEALLLIEPDRTVHRTRVPGLPPAGLHLDNTQRHPQATEYTERTPLRWWVQVLQSCQYTLDFTGNLSSPEQLQAEPGS